MRRLLWSALAVAACGLPFEGPRVRVLAVSPAGSGIDPGVAPAVEFTGPVDPAGLADGRRALLVRASDLSAALAAVESEEGAGPAVPRVACEALLEEGETRLVLRPVVPLEAGERYSVVISSLARAADGREVLDADGRLRPTVSRFETVLPPPPAVLLTEILADAATPEAGGEYVEVLNLGPGPLDLTGWRLEKRSTTGSWSGCTAGPPAGGPTAEGEVALLVGGSWDGRYDVPAGVSLFPCGATALAGGIANDRPPVVRLLDRAGAVAANLDASELPVCGTALAVEDPAAGADASCCACTDVTPGWLP